MNQKDTNLYKKDTELVELTLQNQDNFLYLMQKYEDKLRRYIHRLTNISNEEANDLLQDIFIKVYTNLNDYDKSMKFSSWIYRITYNHVISSFRKKQSRPENMYINDDIDFINTISSSLDLEKETDQKILKDNIINALNKINQKYKDVLILKYLEQKDYKEISDILKKPMGTVATLLNRAKKELKKHLENI